MGYKVLDWNSKEANFSTKEGQDLITGAVAAFMLEPERNKAEIQAAIQHFSTSGDFPAEYKPVLEKFQSLKDYDMGWEEIFDVKDVSGSSAYKNGFAIQTNASGISFKRVVEGDAVKIYDFSGSQFTIGYDDYGAGLNWSRNLIDDGNFWQIEENTTFARNQFYADKSAIFYGLIEALPLSENIAWQAVTPASLATSNENYEAVRDFNTLNKAAETLITDNLNKGYGISPGTVFTVLYPYQLKRRMQRLQYLLNQNISNAPGQTYSFKFVMSISLASSTSYYVAIPKVKKYAVERMPLTIYSEFDIKRRSDLMTAWARFGGAIADIETMKRCATS